MKSGDLIGVAILFSVAVAGVYGLHTITKPVSYTKEEYEKRLKKGSGIARGVMNAVMYPLQELWHPKAVAAVHVIKDLRQGYYDAQQTAGDEVDSQGLVVHQTASTNAPVRPRSRVGQLLRRVLKVFARRR